MNKATLVLAALGCVLGISTAQAAIVRGAGGTKNDGGGQDTAILIAQDGVPGTANSQLWLSNYIFAPVPAQAETDPNHAGLENCTDNLGQIYCTYSVGPGESRRMTVFAGLVCPCILPGAALPTPHLDITWRVRDSSGVLKSFTFANQPVSPPAWTYALSLNGLPFAPNVLTLEVEWTYTLPEGANFYKKQGAFNQGDIRDDESAEFVGRTLTVISATSLTIDEDSLPADETPPVTSASQSPAANANGWNNEDVEVTITATDEAEGSGLAFINYQIGSDSDSSPTSPVVVHVDTQGPTVIDYFAEDAEGNQAATKSHTVNYDNTNPIASAGASPPANADGWNNSNVTVSFSCFDGLSGIATCPANQLLTSDTLLAGQTVSGVATDKAGNTSNQASVTIKLDKTVPTIAGAATTSPNGAGWYKTSVIVHFTCDDLLSGVKTCEADKTLSASGANQSVSGSVMDKAGNSASTSVADIDIDEYKPVVAVTGVSDGATYAPSAVPTAGCSTSDALSGVATAATLALTGGTSNGVGLFSAACNGALDKAGNGNSVSADYKVQYNYSGFFSPVDILPTLNVVKAGQALPVKFALAGNFGLDVLQGTPQSARVPCNDSLPADDIEQTVAAGGSSLSYDPITNQYSYIWKTDKSYKGTCRSLMVTLDDGTVHTALFKFN